MKWKEFDLFFELPFKKVINNNYHFCSNINLCSMSIEEFDEFLSKESGYECFFSIWCDLSYHLALLKRFNNKLYSLGLISNAEETNTRKMQLEIQYNILNNVLKLKPKYHKLWKYYDFKLKQYNKVIGIHIRTGTGDFNDYRIFLNEDDLNKFASTAINFSRNDNSVKWILLSDNSKLLNQYQTNYSNYIFNYLPNRRTYHYGRNISDDSSFKEILLLSHSKYFIITNQSTFSLISLLWSGICINVTKYSDCVKVIGKGVEEHKYPIFDGNIQLIQSF